MIRKRDFTLAKVCCEASTLERKLRQLVSDGRLSFEVEGGFMVSISGILIC
jgi:hypothetical protein